MNRTSRIKSAAKQRRKASGRWGAGSSERYVLFALGWYYPEIHRGVVRFARDHRWHVTADFDDLVPKHWQGDGVITLLGARQDLWKSLRKLDVPIVDLAESRPDIRLPRVTMDNAAIGRMAARYFLDRGYRNFAFFHRWGLGASHRRRDSFQAELARYGYDCEVLSWKKGRGKSADTRDQRHRWLIHHLTVSPKPLALFAMRDIEAVEVIEACLSADLSVPEQISVLGVDNSETICDCLRVPLSSIDNNLEQVGYEGAALLERLISGESPPTTPLYIPPSGVVERRSTDCMAVNHPGVAAALRYIQENAHLPICMTDVIGYVAMSRSGLEKAFRDHFVRAPMEELRRVRFDRARKMLRETDEKIITVARVTGFQTSHNLCRAFSQNLSLTPKQYRLKHRDAPV